METLSQRIAGHARLTPHAPAVLCGDQVITYGQLLARADAIAARLAGSVGAGDIVHVRMPRGAPLLQALVSVWRAGAAYVVSEITGAPGSSLPAALAQHVAAELSLGDDGQILIERRRGPALDAAGQAMRARLGPAAYLLLTSGTTGDRKAVAVTSDNIAHYCLGLLDRLGTSGPLTCGHVSSLEADLGNTSLFLAWWTGGAAALATDLERRDPEALARWAGDARLSLLKLTPSHWRAVMPAFASVGGDRAPLPHLLLGGETLSIDLAEQTLSTGRIGALWNHYGPTETTIGVAAFAVTDLQAVKAAGHASVPIGRALGRAGFLLRDAHGALREGPGRGELVVFGPTVSAGYLGPAATSGTFVDLGDDRGRAYCTGDQVAIRPDGVVEYLGRNDRQVKLDGRRVDLGVVESALSALLDGRQVACWLVDPEGRRRLAVAIHGTPDAIDIDRFCTQAKLDHGVNIAAPMARTISDWPLTANGKTDQSRLLQLFHAAGAQKHVAMPAPNPALAVATAIWREQLGLDEIAADADFFTLGGDSLDAIAVLGRMQTSGYRVDAARFLAKPTLAVLVEATARPDVSSQGDDRPVVRAAMTSALRHWHVPSAIVAPDWHNQAMMLSIAQGLSLDALERALGAIVAAHPLLRSRLDLAGQGWTLGSSRDQGIAAEAVLPTVDAIAADKALQRLCEAAQQSLDLAAGRLLAVRLIRGRARDLLLLVGHHAAFDAVSWRIFIAELFLQLDRPATPGGASDLATLDAWVQEERAFRSERRRDIAHYLDTLRPLVPAHRLPLGDGVPEQEMRAAWFALSHDQTERFRHAVAQSGIHAGSFLLAALASAWRTVDGSDTVWIDIEGHGRVRSGSGVDVSNSLGWFTTVTPVAIDCRLVAGESAADAVRQALARVPAHVQEIGIEPADLQAAGLAAPILAYNYLGEWRAPRSARWEPRFAGTHAGRARGPGNLRAHQFTMTGRITDGRLAVDIAHPRAETEKVEALAIACHGALLGAIGAPIEPAHVLHGPNASGQLAYAPALLVPPADSAAPDCDYRMILITGATGFLGIHLLCALLDRTNAQFQCLVRAADAAEARSRLREAFECYGFGSAWHRAQQRLAVIAGDIGAPGLGLDRSAYARLCQGVDAVYHCAADVRLLAPAAAIYPVNVEGTRHLLGFAQDAGQIDFHHVSTLSVAGAGNSRRLFDEDSFDIGQSFRNPYEASKFAAERLVRDYGRLNARAAIYRMGNVAAHSVTGQFQRNAAENQLVQMLRAVLRLGILPEGEHQSLALSPVDVVAGGIAALSLRANLSGTFHVESPHQISLQQLLRQLARHVRPLVPRPGATLRDVLATASLHTDHELATAAFWAGRPAPAVSFEHDKTAALLKEAKIVFPVPSDAWLASFVAGLDGAGALGAPGAPTARPAETAEAVHS
jgi:thioester reductase-like protein